MAYNILQIFDEITIEQAKLISRQKLKPSADESFLDRVLSEDETKTETILARIRQRENNELELKSSFRYDFKLKMPNPRVLEKVIAKTVVAFMNAKGGTLIIGVDDQGQIIGLQNDYSTLKKQDSDGFEIELRQSIEKYTKKRWVGEQYDLKFHKVENKQICEINIYPSRRPVFIYDEGKQSECYVRIGNSSVPYSYEDFLDYVKQRFEE